MSKVGEFFKSHHIQLALATGASIIVLAYVSKRVLAVPMDNLALSFPPFLAVVGELVMARYRDSRIGAPRYWVLAILLSTAVIVALYLV